MNKIQQYIKIELINYLKHDLNELLNDSFLVLLDGESVPINNAVDIYDESLIINNMSLYEYLLNTLMIVYPQIEKDTIKQFKSDYSNKTISTILENIYYGDLIKFIVREEKITINKVLSLSSHKTNKKQGGYL